MLPELSFAPRASSVAVSTCKIHLPHLLCKPIPICTIDIMANGCFQASTEAFLGTSGAGQASRRSRTASLVHQSAVGKLVNFLAQQGQPDPLLSVLSAVDTDAQQLPPEATQERDADGRSFLTRWLPSWIQSQQPSGPSMPEGGTLWLLPVVRISVQMLAVATRNDFIRAPLQSMILHSCHRILGKQLTLCSIGLAVIEMPSRAKPAFGAPAMHWLRACRHEIRLLQPVTSVDICFPSPIWTA